MPGTALLNDCLGCYVQSYLATHIRRLTSVVHIMNLYDCVPIGPLREALSRSFGMDCSAVQQSETIQNDVKLFPILVINTGLVMQCL